jgi:ABC-type polysaccharide/polyol phosphate export permease
VLIGLIVLTIGYAVYRNLRPRVAKAQQGAP